MEPTEIENFVFRLPLLAILLCLSAFFSGSETALFSLTREELDKLRDRGTRISKIILQLLSDPKKLLITILFGNMVVNVLFFSFSFVMGFELVHSMGNTELILGISSRSILEVIFGFASLLVLIICGEVTPKSISVNFPRRIALMAAIPLYVFHKLFFPFRFILEFIIGFFTSVFERKSAEEKYITADELRMLIEVAEKQKFIDRSERTMLQGVVDLGETKVREVMVPRVDIAFYNLSPNSHNQEASASEIESQTVRENRNDTHSEFIELVRRTRHSKIPVYEGTIDEVKGVIYAQDVFLHPEKNLKDLIEPVSFVPETKTVESLLQEFRDQHTQMAMVVDEYGGTAGLVTLEDILEEIVGEIGDEFDKEEEEIKKISEDVYLLSGNLNIRDWSDLFAIQLGASRFDTLGGFVISLLDHFPKKGEKAYYSNLEFTVDSVKGKRIKRILLKRMKERKHVASSSDSKGVGKSFNVQSSGVALDNNNKVHHDDAEVSA